MARALRPVRRYFAALLAILRWRLLAGRDPALETALR